MAKGPAARGRQTPAKRRHDRRPAAGLGLYIGLIVVVGTLTYANSLTGPFIFDDRPSILRNESIQQLSHVAKALAPPSETSVAGRPIVNLSLAVNYAVGGFDVVGYHIWNVAVHVASALLLFGIARRTFLASRAGGEFHGAANLMAAGGALVWMVHPLQTEPVDYVIQRTESMMGFFLFLTLYCAIRSHRSTDGPRWQIASVTACALGMACKESMVVAPLIVLLYDRIFEFDSIHEAIGRRWRMYAALAATWLVLAALMWNTPRSTVGTSTGLSRWTYLLNQFEMIVAYLRLAVWPHALVTDYGMPRTLLTRDVIPQMAVVGSLALATLAALVRWPRIGFLGVAFFMTLAPTTSIVPIASEVGAERRMYVPLAALAILAALTARWAFGQLKARTGERSARITGGTFVAVVLIALATRTVYRNRDYQTPLSLWQTSVDRRPQGRARTLLASELIEAGRRDEGLAQLREAIRDYPTAHFALGTELYAAGQFEDAIAELRPLTLTIDSHKVAQFMAAEHLIGRALAAEGKWPEAAAVFQRLLDQVPSDADTHGLLADILFEQKRFDEAIPHYQTLLARHADISSAWDKLGVSLASVGRLDEAIDDFGRVAALDPAFPGVQRNLAHAFLERGDAHQAELHAREAISLAPDDATAHGMLAVSLASQHAVDEAINEFQRTLELNPADPVARDGLARALRMRQGQRAADH